MHVNVSDTDISRYSRYNYNYIFVHGIICTPFVEDVVLTVLLLRLGEVTIFIS